MENKSFLIRVIREIRGETSSGQILASLRRCAFALKSGRNPALASSNPALLQPQSKFDPALIRPNPG
jgi:hypothetical protein